MRYFPTLIAVLPLVVAACGTDEVGSAGQATLPSRDTIVVDTARNSPVEPIGIGLAVDGSGAAPTGSAPDPDVAASILADDGTDPLPLGSVTTLPDSPRLDFLFEFCWNEPCYRDAHFIDPDNPGYGSGGYLPDTPFHVRHGFVNNDDEPLGDGFDVTLYVTPLDRPGEFGGLGTGDTNRYTSDYVVRGTSEACGPTYRTQTEPETCEWFVHEFDDGLPAGRHAMWAVWEAPCSAWVDLGFTDSCTDPSESISLFSSGFDAPYETSTPSYEAQSHVGLTPEQIDELQSGWIVPEDSWFVPELLGPWFVPDSVVELVVDGSGAAPTGSAPDLNVAASILADDGTDPLPLGSVTTLPDSPRLDFLFEFCWGEPCYRDAHFMNPNNPGYGSGTYQADTPFHVRHGFVNNDDEPLADEFDVTLYVTELENPGEFGGLSIGDTYRYTSDYVVRGTSEACGPASRTQTEPQTCEWFVHDFPNGLPEGRHAMWAVWEAPCSAWVDYGFTDNCTEPNKVISLFSSGFDAPYGSSGPSYDERSHAAQTPPQLFDEIR